MKTLNESDRFVLAGKLMSALDRHEDALALFSEGLALVPDDPRLLRHRGHRRISTRDYAGALEDLSRAAELIDGKPDEIEFYGNETREDVIHVLLGRGDRVRDQHVPVTPETIESTRNLYKSTLNFNVWYHLALTRFLLGEYEASLADYARAGEAAIDDDARSAVTDWTYLLLRRLGRDDEAQSLLDGVHTGVLHINQRSPLYFNRLRLYKGEVTPDELLTMVDGKSLALASLGFAVGNWYLHQGRPDEAREAFDLVLRDGNRYAFAYLAAEAERDRISSPKGPTA